MFTSDEKLEIVEIVAIAPTLLDACLFNLGSDLTSEKETKVIAAIAEWRAGAREADASFTPTNSNEGFGLKTQAATRRIARAIRLTLDIPPEYCANLSGTGSIEIGL